MDDAQQVESNCNSGIPHPARRSLLRSYVSERVCPVDGKSPYEPRDQVDWNSPALRLVHSLPMSGYWARFARPRKPSKGIHPRSIAPWTWLPPRSLGRLRPSPCALRVKDHSIVHDQTQIQEFISSKIGDDPFFGFGKGRALIAITSLFENRPLIQ